ncbi:MAG: hypothetical protein ABI690_16865 [Chloroflexota bacterium]
MAIWLVMTVLVMLFLGIGRIAPPSPQVYILSWQPGDPLSIRVLDVDLNMSIHFAPQPSLPGAAVSDWALSPDGEHFAMKNAYDLMGMDNRGRNQHWLTQDGTNNHNPAWSPDGAKIVFVSERDNNSEIYVMDADGGNPTRLTHNDVYDVSPSWSADGKYVAFTSYQDGDPDIYVMDDNGDNLHHLTDNPFFDALPVWSPDGQHILFLTNRGSEFFQLYVMNADGTDQHVVTSEVQNITPPSWSPDGQFIMFEGVVNNSIQMVVADADGSRLRTVPGWNLPLMTPLWFRP